MNHTSHPVIIVLDLEATMRSHDIIEIGAVCLTNEQGTYTYTDKFHTYVRPTPLSKLDKSTTELTGITKEDVLNAPCFHKALNQLIEWIGDREFYFCTWSETDILFLQKACEKHRRKLDWIQNYNDLQALYGRKWHEGVSNQVGLKAALEEANVQLTGQHHSAIFDAVNTAKIFLNRLSVDDLVKSASLQDAFDEMDVVKFGFAKRKQEREKLESPEYRKLIEKIRRRRKRLYADFQSFSEATSISPTRLRKIEYFAKVASNYEINRMLQTLNRKKEAM